MPKRYRYTKPKTFLTIVLSIFLLFMISTAVILPDLASRMDILRQQNEKKDDKYIVRMRELFEENETITLKDIFNDFDFAYAYVFNDPNINGETLAKRYELDLNLSNVKELNSDHYRRIIFLDENKEVVFNWVYSVYEVLILVGGYYVEPDVTISREDVYTSAMVIRFEDVKEENYFGAYPEKAQLEFNESIKDLTMEELIEQNAGIDNTQCMYGDYFFLIPTEPEDKHQFLYRKKGNETVLILYSEYGINTVSLGQEVNTIQVFANVMIDGVLMNVPIALDVTEYDRDMIWAAYHVS